MPIFFNWLVWFEVIQLPANSTFRMRYIRPDGSVAFDAGTKPLNQTFLSDMNVTGTWRLQLDVDGTTISSSPFSVVSN
jgi:hypothetical protein